MRCLIVQKTASLGTSLQIIVMTWAVLEVLIGKTGLCTLEGSKRRELALRLKKWLEGISKSSVKLSVVRRTETHICLEVTQVHCLDDSETGWAVKVLQYRSVAFVTYKSELHAQFAKEAMACQSLDNDEILNVRWATEDPNPVSKVNEKHRLEEMGQAAIREKMDPRVVDAMRTIRALEDGDVLDDEGNLIDNGHGEYSGEEDEDTGREAKRRKLDVDDNATPPPSVGLLSSDTMDSLRYFSEIRKRNGLPPPAATRKAPPTTPVGLDLGDYGSDDED